MPSTTEDLLNEIMTDWDMERCLTIGKVVRCFSPGIQERIDTNHYDIVEGGIVHMNLRIQLQKHFRDMENQNGKDES